jgi:signal transduction histidine kinase
MKPRASLRLRLAAWYAITLVFCGGALLGVAYIAVTRSIATFDSDLARAMRQASARQAARDLEAGRPPLPFAPPRVVSREERAARRRAEADAREHQRKTLLQEFLTALGGLALVAGLIGWVVAGRALRPLGRVTATAKRVTARRLGERIALGGPRDELRELADTVDGMLDRLELAFASQQRFIAHASHELRTPLAVIRAELETTLADPSADANELRRMAAVVHAAVGRTETLIASLLTLARSDAALERRVTVDLAELAEALLDEFSGEVHEHGLRLEHRLEEAWISGEPALLETVITNLLQNAVRYNRAGGASRFAAILITCWSRSKTTASQLTRRRRVRYSSHSGRSSGRARARLAAPGWDSRS